MENAPTEVGAAFNGKYRLTMFLNFYLQLLWSAPAKIIRSGSHPVHPVDADRKTPSSPLSGRLASIAVGTLSSSGTASAAKNRNGHRHSHDDSKRHRQNIIDGLKFK